MTTFHPVRRKLLIGTTLVASVWLAGCASPPTPGMMVSMPAGTVTTFQRVSTGSYGTVNAPVTWVHGEREWQGRTVVEAASPQAGTNLLDPATHRTIATFSAKGDLVMSFEPAVGYQWPLAVGKTWTDRHTVTLHPSGRQVPLQISYRVEAREDVTVPAGTFTTWKVVGTDSLGEVQQYWTAPELGLPTIKRISDRPATHPQGAGHLEGVLTAVRKP